MTFTQFHDEQGSDTWLQSRCGVLTASVIGKMITAKTLKPASNDTSRAIAKSLVAEMITGYVEPVFVNDDMWRGTLAEPIARDLYATHYTDLPVVEAGFMTRDDDGPTVGFSPDGLVGDEGLLEIKAPRQGKHFSTILNGYPPVEHMPQLQTGLYVSGRAWIDFVSYNAGMPMSVKRVYPDAKWREAIIATARAFEANAAEQIALYVENSQGFISTERQVEKDLAL